MKSQRIVIDVREPFEYEEGHVAGALNIPLANLAGEVSSIEDIDKNSELIVYCRSGGRANTALEILKQLGYTNLINGINAEHVAKHYTAS